MKHINFTLFLTMLMSMVGENSYSYILFSVKNSDGVYIYYQIKDNSVVVSSRDGVSSYGSSANETAYVGNVIIPESVTYSGKSYTVTGIENYAFCFCSSLKSVTIPNSVTRIGYSAFSGCSELTNVDLPNSVTSIGSSAFYNCKNLSSITIPNSVTSIGEEAFANTEWYNKQPKGLIYAGNVAYKYKGNMLPDTRIELKDGTIGVSSKAFEGCINLASIIIPNTLVSIYSDAFRECTGLKKVVLNSNEIVSRSYSSDYCFSKIFGKQVNEYILGNEVTTIGNYAFYGCSGLTSITIPNSVTGIGKYAFYNTRLKSITIGSGVLSIGDSAFGYNYANYVEQGAKPVKVIWLTNTPPSGYYYAEGTLNYVANDLYTSLSNKTVYPFLSSMFEVDGIKYVPVSPSERTCDAINCAYDETAENINIGNIVTYKGIEMKLNAVNDYVCIGNSHIKDVKLTYRGEVPYQAFYGCTGLQTATITNDGSINKEAFCGCVALQTATISNNGDIGEKAFLGCNALQTASISNNGYIGINAFMNSMQGQPATIEVANKGYIGASAFYGCTALQTATISNNGDIGASAFEGSMTKSLANVYLHNKGNIYEKAFYGCTKLETATLGDEIPSLGYRAFYNCSSLQSIIVPDAVSNIGERAFENCSSMTSAKIGSGVTTIPTYAFSDCSSLTDLQIGQNVKNIDTYAFNNCKALESISIPQSVTDIKDYVFSGCTGLKNVTMEDRMDDTTLTLGSNGTSPMFSDCLLDNVYIGRNISYSTYSSNGYSPFYRNTSLRSVTITDKETEISENEFYGCTNLKEVKIGDGVTTIGNRAFSGCSSLDYFAFGSAVKTIGEEAFSDCTAMTKLISKASTPPTCGTQALDDINKWTCTLQVPASSLSLYQQASQWKEFFFIEGVTGIKNISGNSANKLTIKSSYDLNGKQFSQPQKGLNILKMSDGTTKKVVK